MNARSLVLKLALGRELLRPHSRHILPIGLTLLLGAVLAPLLAVAIVSENWPLASFLVASIPAAIFLNRYPFAAIGIWMLVMPWFPFRGVYKYVYFAVHRVLIPMALAFNILSRLLKLKEHRPVRLGVVDLAMAAFAGLGVVSIFVTGNHWKQVFVLQDQFLVSFAAYWLVRFSNAQERQLERIIPLMLLLTLVQGAIGLVSWFAPAILPPIWRFASMGKRTVGTFGQPAIYGCVLVSLSVLVYHRAMNRERGIARTTQILTLVLVIVCVFFTFTRGAWLVGILALFALLYMYPRPTAALVSAVLVVAILLSANVLADEFALARERLQSSEQDANARLVLANAGRRMFYAKPVFGWGFGNYDRYDWRFLERVREFTPTEWQIKKGTSHHTYLTILAEMGVVGFTLYALPVFWWLALSIKSLSRLPKDGLWSRRLLVIMWMSIVVHIIIAQDLDMRFFYYCLTLFWINLGFIANLVQGCLRPDGLGSRWVYRRRSE